MYWRLLLWAECLTYFFKFYGMYGTAQRHNAQNVLKSKINTIYSKQLKIKPIDC